MGGHEGELDELVVFVTVAQEETIWCVVHRKYGEQLWLTTDLKANLSTVRGLSNAFYDAVLGVYFDGVGERVVPSIVKFRDSFVE